MNIPGNLDIKVPSLYIEKRLDLFLADLLTETHTRKQIKAALDEGTITLNGKPAKPSSLVREGDRIEGRIAPSTRTSAVAAETIPVKVIYEDDSLLVIDKPTGMVVHPGAGRRSGTLVNALLGRGGTLSTTGGSDRPGIVHRLDKDTSGLLLVAKTDLAHRRLQGQFEARTLEKIYLALVSGRVAFEEGHIDAPIGRHPRVRTKRSVSSAHDAREAWTGYKVIERMSRASLLEVKLLTGRTHQIRVHMAHLGHPVLGDSLYGKPGALNQHRLALHAARITFEHPVSGERVTFESPIPEDLKKMIEEERSVKRP